jgi:hypothetical protein
MESSKPNRTTPSRPGRFHRGRALAVTALTAGTAVAAPAPVTAAADASERSAPSPAINWTGCGTELECARVSVTTPARGTLCPSDHGPFDPGFGQPTASR